MKINNKTINEIENEYKSENDIFDESVLRILNSLNETDRRIMILYSELQSYRKVSEILGVSHTLLGKKINNIKQLLQRRLKED